MDEGVGIFLSVSEILQGILTCREIRQRVWDRRNAYPSPQVGGPLSCG
jgi:hypothetical protein